MSEPDPMTLPWSDPRADVIGQFRAFVEKGMHAPPRPLAPWQEQVVEAVLTGKQLMMVQPRSAGRSQVERLLTKYMGEPKPIKGCHTSLLAWYDEAAEVQERDRRWHREYLGTWTDEASPSRVPWTHPPDLADLPEPDPAFDTLDLCVQPFARR